MSKIVYYYATEAAILALTPSSPNWVDRAFYYPEDKAYFYQALNGVMKKYSGDHNELVNTHNLTSDIDHDKLANYSANQHIDWTNASANFKTSGDGFFGGDLTFGGNVGIVGDFVLLRQGAEQGLQAGEYTGIFASLYNGTDDGIIGLNNAGEVYAGTVGAVNRLAKIEDGPTNNYYAYWHSDGLLKTKQIVTADISDKQLAQSGVTYGYISDVTQTIAGVKSFLNFPTTPSSAPTQDYEVANKKYVDDNAGSSYTFSNGLTDTGGSVILGGSMTFGAELALGTTEFLFSSANYEFSFSNLNGFLINYNSSQRFHLSSTGMYANGTAFFEPTTLVGSESIQIAASSTGGNIVFRDSLGDTKTIISGFGNTIFNAGPVYVQNSDFAGANISGFQAAAIDNEWSFLAADGIAKRFGVKQDPTNGAELYMYNNSNALNVFLNANGDSYFKGGRVGVGISPATTMHVYTSNAEVVRAERVGGTNVNYSAKSSEGAAYFGKPTGYLFGVSAVLDLTNAYFKILNSGAATFSSTVTATNYIGTTIPTSASGLSAGSFFTQTAAQLGGTGTTKVLCIV